MQLLFLSGSKTLLWSEIQRFSASNMQLFFSLWIEEAALERSSTIFQPRTCSCFFFSDRRGCFGAKLSDFSASNMPLLFRSGSRLLWSEIERIFGFEHAAVISLWIEDAALQRS